MSHPECSVCAEKYNETHESEPRTLPCGHTFCRSCIGRINQLCPTCRRAFNDNDVVTNHILIRVLCDTVTRVNLSFDRDCAMCGKRIPAYECFYCGPCYRSQQISKQPFALCDHCKMWMCDHMTSERLPLVSMDESLRVQKALQTDSAVNECMTQIVKKCEALVIKTKTVTKEINRRVNSFHDPASSAANKQFVHHMKEAVENPLEDINFELKKANAICDKIWIDCIET